MSVIESTKQFAPAGTWAADPVHSNVSFEVGYSGVNTFRGSFTDFQATLAGGESPALEGSAKVASVDVKDEQLNGHLQSPDFFDAERHPEISFRATELHRLDDDTRRGLGRAHDQGRHAADRADRHDRSRPGDRSVRPRAARPQARDRDRPHAVRRQLERTEPERRRLPRNDVKLIAELAFVKAEA